MKFDDEQLDIVDDEDVYVNDDKLDENLDYGETVADDEQHDDETAAPAKKSRGKVEVIVNVILWIAIAVLGAIVVLRLFVYNSVAVSGVSMSPTYQDGDVVVVNKLIKPERGDVVVFYLNDVDSKLKAMFAKEEDCREGQPYEKLIKRVIATEGDKLWVQRISGNDNGGDEVYQVIVLATNGKRYCEDYYVKKGESLEQSNFFIHTAKASNGEHVYTGLGILTDYSESNPFVVSKNCFFAMGDHRYNSRDSREFGEFPLSRLFGVVLDK